MDLNKKTVTEFTNIKKTKTDSLTKWDTNLA